MTVRLFIACSQKLIASKLQLLSVAHVHNEDNISTIQTAPHILVSKKMVIFQLPKNVGGL